MKCLAALAVLLIPTLAFAWGGEGHQVVALIAEERLTPAAVAGIEALLGPDVEISDAEVASWADVVRRERRTTAPWHYVNIPIDVAAYDPARHGNGDAGNIITAIAAQESILADESRPAAVRAGALQLLAHLFGDVHRPLAEPFADNGCEVRKT